MMYQALTVRSERRRTSTMVPPLLLVKIKSSFAVGGEPMGAYLCKRLGL